MAPRTILLATIMALVAGLLVVPPALAAAVPAQVRVAGLDREVVAPLTVSVPAQSVAIDSGGTQIVSTNANAFSAFAIAAARSGVPYATNGATAATAVFVNSIAGLGGPPSWTSWWGFSANGWFADVGAGSLALKAGDSVVFFEVPGTAPSNANFMLLVVRITKRGLLPGQPVQVKVVADDLAKANSAADAQRFGLTAVETPAQFAPVAGATVHVGAQTFTADANGYATVPDLPDGTYGIWAEKALSGSTDYVRSQVRQADIRPAPVLSHVVVRPNPFAPGIDAVRVAFDLSKAAHIDLTVRTRSGALVATVSAMKAAGRRAIIWNGRAANGRPVAAGVYRLRLAATDTWGRSTALPLLVTAR